MPSRKISVNGRDRQRELDFLQMTHPAVSFVFLPAQYPGDTGSGTLHALDKVVAWIQLEYRVDRLALVIRRYLLGILLNRAQNRVFGFAFLIPWRIVKSSATPN